MDEPVHALALWLWDLATDLGDVEREIMAGEAAVISAQRLDDYRDLRQACLAIPGRWEQVRLRVLAALSEPSDYISSGAIDVLLEEGMVEQALSAVERYRLRHDRPRGGGGDFDLSRSRTDDCADAGGADNGQR